MNTVLHTERLARAREGLEGLSVGDAFGQRFFGDLRQAHRREVPPDPYWRYTDDTNMALSIYAVLRQKGEIDQDVLALHFAAHFEGERGYGHGARRLLTAIRMGEDWRESAARMFSGEGSYGNGSAMRIAPLAGYFADDLALCAEHARLSAAVTHAHHEGIQGGIAAAVAGAVAWQARSDQTRLTRRALIEAVLPYVADSEVQRGLIAARDLDGVSALEAAQRLGNGSLISCQDTVPICLWLAGEFLSSYEEALWQTVSIGGDIDTNAAVVGGIVALYTGAAAIPQVWRARRERLPAWAIGA
jgi:ADP-ribosylglycohydrolase